MAAWALALITMIFWRWSMAKPSAVTVFLAVSSLLLASADLPVVQAQEAGGLKEWSTDQAVDDDSVMNEEAEALLKKAEQEDVCVPIGEGENCW
ncbi:hypothetical protein [Synechococcus sp. A15-44]|uniref:hypothetical protein n=1 Tax=Synechococcus sp. A15-44 TaxID=1050646 RepID=UPI00351C84E7